jgi:hypothetical protein
VALELASLETAALDFAPVEAVAVDESAWPGSPLIVIVDGRSAVMAGRRAGDVNGHWSTAPTFVAAARLAIAALRGAG